jgi:type IV pilus assembly protein PilW
MDNINMSPAHPSVKAGSQIPMAMGRSRSICSHRPLLAQRGFTLIELMIGLAVSLVTTLAITQILLTSESQKRTTTSGSDAQVSGVLAMDTLRNSIQMAGYGFTNLPASNSILGCPLETKFKGSSVVGFAPNLIPVVITDGASSAPDSIRVLSSSKSSFSIPHTMIDPGYVAGNATLGNAFPVAASTGAAVNDIMVAATDDTAKCQVFQATSVTSTSIGRVDDTGWNSTGFPSNAFNAVTNSVIINMGQFDDVNYSVSNAGNLQFNRLVLAADFTPSYTGNVNLYSNIVNMQAYYGKATAAKTAVTVWDNTTPTTNANWLLVQAVRIAVVSRSDQYEKTEVTTADPLWDVGSGSTITGAATCGASKCITLKIPRAASSTEWKHYRYKVFDSIIPLRNMLWGQ